jgi:hypothetical protein
MHTLRLWHSVVGRGLPTTPRSCGCPDNRDGYDQTLYSSDLGAKLVVWSGAPSSVLVLSDNNALPHPHGTSLCMTLAGLRLAEVQLMQRVLKVR